MTLQSKKKIICMLVLFFFMILIPLLATGKAKKDFIFASDFDKTLQAGAKAPKSCNKSFCVLDESSGNVIEIPDREFLYGVVASEMPACFSEEALKAQAVASYTYFCRSRNSFENAKSKEKPYAFTINTEKWINYVTAEQTQKKWGSNFQKYHEIIVRAVDSVFGEVIEQGGELILAVYHAISSGKTEKSRDVFGGDLSYLTNVESPGDREATGYETRVEVPKEKFKEILCSRWSDCNVPEDPEKWVGERTCTEGGMTKEIVLCSHKAKGTEIRSMFALCSSCFDVKYNCESEKFIFTVWGYGHGVGMSQRGADFMAKHGADYKKILQWYYPGTSITHFHG